MKPLKPLPRFSSHISESTERPTRGASTAPPLRYRNTWHTPGHHQQQNAALILEAERGVEKLTDLADKLQTILVPIAILRDHPSDPRELAVRILWHATTAIAKREWGKVEAYMREHDLSDDDGDLRYRLATDRQSGAYTGPILETYEEAARRAYSGLGWEYDGDFDRVARRERKRALIDEAPFAAIHGGLLGDLHRGAWPPDLFRVYVAVCSMLGGADRGGGKRVHTPRVLRYDEIARRADGYTKATAPDGFNPSLSTKAVRYRVGQLIEKGLLNTYSRRHTRDRWYWLPHRVSESRAYELIAQAEAARNHSATQERRRARVAELAAALRGKKTERRYV